MTEFSPRVKAEQATYRLIFNAAEHPEHRDEATYECDRCTALACAIVDEVIGEHIAACTGCGTCSYCKMFPRGLCGNRDDHAPHLHESLRLGRMWCEADQTKRLPFAMERRAAS